MIKSVRKAIVVILTVLLVLPVLPISTVSAASDKPIIPPYNGNFQFQSDVDVDGQYKGSYCFYQGVAKFWTRQTAGSSGSTKWGLCDINGNHLGSLYDDIADFSEGLARAYNYSNPSNGMKDICYLKTDGSVAFKLPSTITFDGNVYDVTMSRLFHNGMAEVSCVLQPGGISSHVQIFYYIDKSGKKALPKREGYFYALATDFRNGVAFVEELEQYTQNATGITYFRVPNKITANIAYTAIDINGKSLYEVSVPIGERFNPWLDKNGNIVTLPYSIEEKGIDNDGMGICKIQGQSKYSVINLDTAEIVFTIDDIIFRLGDTYFSEGLLPAKGDNGKVGFLDKAGKWAILPQYIGASNFSDGLAIIGEENSQSGYIDKSGKKINVI